MANLSNPYTSIMTISISPNSPALLSQWQMTKYVNAASLALWIYDYCISIEIEVRLVCGRKWDPTRVLFSLTRYLTLPGTIIGIYSVVQTNMQDCGTFENAGNTLQIMDMIGAECLLTLRIYAFWAPSKLIIACLVTTWAILTPIVIVVITKMQPYEHYPSSKGCLFLEEKSAAILYAVLAVYELLLLILTVIKRRSYPESPTFSIDTDTPIYVTLYRDNLVYMISVFGVSVANIIMHVAAPFGYSSVLDIIQVVLHSCLASRIHFNLREIDIHRFSNATQPIGLSGLQFAQDSVPVSENVA